MSSNEKKNATLGMSHGTASNRLRKNIMFSLLYRLGENVCYRCRATISSVEELSVEHIEPWEGISAALFWDLNNISFSHMRCNRPHRLGSSKIQTPEGTAWCSKHQRALSVNEFFARSCKDDGLDDYCKACRREKDTRQNHAKKVSAVD